MATDPLVLQLDRGQEIELCWIDTLDGMGEPGEPVYVTRVLPTLTPLSHHVDVRLAPPDDAQVAQLQDGWFDCDLWKELGGQPLMSTEDSTEAWEFDAPLATTASHRVLINQHYINRAVQEPGVAEIGVTLTLECMRDEPPEISDAFAFIREEIDNRVRILPGERLALCASCNVDVDVRLKRLFRRTHLISDFTALRNGAPLWRAGFSSDNACRPVEGNNWRCEFDDPLRLTADDVLQWQCVYENTGDRPIEIGTDDDCSLYGTYIRSTEASEVRPCVRHASASESAAHCAALGISGDTAR